MTKNIFAVIALSILAVLAADFSNAAYTVNGPNCEDAAVQNYCKGVEQAVCQEALKACLKYFEDAAKVYEDSVKDAKEKSNTLKGEIAGIQSRIKKLNNDISKNSLMIKDLTIQVKNTGESISESEKNLENLRNQLKDLLISAYKEDSRTAIEIFLSGEDLTDNIDNLVGFKSLSYRNQVLVQNIEDLKSNLEKQKVKLDSQKNQLEENVAKQEVQKVQNISLQQEKDKILKETKGQEALFQKFKAEAEQRAAKLRARIFELAGGGVPGISKAPSFGEALEYAKQAGNAVGVRPSFILAILAQETRIGKNVGRCYVVNEKGYGANGKPVMSPKQAPSFIAICSAAGLDYAKTPVSCPAPQIGCKYGGAMGPAQFMPTTWDLFKDQIRAYVGHEPNPWNTQDAFYAAALFVKDAGAGASGTGELKAAARYFGSGAYGYQNQVAVKATCIQTFIDQGTMSDRCESLIF